MATTEKQLNIKAWFSGILAALLVIFGIIIAATGGTYPLWYIEIMIALAVVYFGFKPFEAKANK